MLKITFSPATIPSQHALVLTVAEGHFNMWLLTMASDLADHELRTLIITLRGVHTRIARARDHA